MIHNLRSGVESASPSVDGDQAHIFAQKLKADHPARLALERLQNPPEWELYDLKDDPIEFFNLSSDPSFDDEARRLKKALVDWQLKTEDPFVDAEFHERVISKYQKATN